jgi:hypothetical protein
MGDIGLDNSGGNPNLTTINLPGGGSVTSRYVGHINVIGNRLINSFGGVSVYTDTNRYPDNIDNDSACSIPLGALDQPNNSTYYRQTKLLQVDSANISGSSVSTSGGSYTLCSDYGTTQTSDGYQDIHTQAPSVGMAVYNEDANTFLGNIASVSSVPTPSRSTARPVTPPEPASLSRPTVAAGRLTTSAAGLAERPVIHLPTTGTTAFGAPAT